MSRKLTRSEIRKFIMEAAQQDQVNEDFLSDLVPDAIKDMYSGLKSDAKDEIRDYIREEVSSYLKDNAKDIAANAPVGTQTIVEDMINNTHDEMGDCAGNIAAEYIIGKMP